MLNWGIWRLQQWPSCCALHPLCSCTRRFGFSFKCLVFSVVFCRCDLSFFLRSWRPSRPGFRSWRWKKRRKDWRRRRGVMQEICSSWPAALDLVRQPRGSYPPCGLLLRHIIVQLNADYAFGRPQRHIRSQVCRMAASRQVRGSHILHHLANTCVPCASSLPNETKQRVPGNQKGPPCCLWWFSFFLHLLVLFTLPFLPFGSSSEQRWQSGGEPDSEMCATKRWCKKDVLAKVIMVFISHGVNCELCRPYSLYAAALLQNQCIQFCFCFLHRTFLQHDSWGEDRRRQQISLRRKCKTCMSVFSSYWACFFGVFFTPLIWLHC